MGIEKGWFYVSENFRFRVHEENELPDIPSLPPEFQGSYLVDYERKVGETWEESECDYATDAEIALWRELQNAQK